MKVILFLTIFASSITIQQTIAQDNSDILSKNKTEVLSKIDKRIAILNELKSCLQKAQLKKEITNCRKLAKEKGQNLKEKEK